ncbi:hypothetical protein BJ742DRAFT_806318 [Cladochytrium replicatum]|nr:hypothetical protein BJ742DRAFT_806318 [Cladochytrium replicatum]
MTSPRSSYLGTPRSSNGHVVPSLKITPAASDIQEEDLEEGHVVEEEDYDFEDHQVEGETSSVGATDNSVSDRAVPPMSPILSQNSPRSIQSPPLSYTAPPRTMELSPSLSYTTPPARSSMISPVPSAVGSKLSQEGSSLPPTASGLPQSYYERYQGRNYIITEKHQRRLSATSLSDYVLEEPASVGSVVQANYYAGPVGNRPFQVDHYTSAVGNRVVQSSYTEYRTAPVPAPTSTHPMPLRKMHLSSVGSTTSNTSELIDNAVHNLFSMVEKRLTMEIQPVDVPPQGTPRPPQAAHVPQEPSEVSTVISLGHAPSTTNTEALNTYFNNLYDTAARHPARNRRSYDISVQPPEPAAVVPSPMPPSPRAYGQDDPTQPLTRELPAFQHWEVRSPKKYEPLSYHDDQVGMLLFFYGFLLFPCWFAGALLRKPSKFRRLNRVMSVVAILIIIGIAVFLLVWFQKV